jgi:hypothetical protein
MSTLNQRALVRNSNSRLGLQIGSLKAPCDQNEARLRHLVERLHALGPGPLLYFTRELMAGADLAQTLECYGRLPCELVHSYGGDRLPRPFFVVRGERQ